MIALIAACGEPPATAVVDQAYTDLDADAVVYGMQNYLTREGVREGVVLSDTAYVYQDSAQVRMWGVEMTLFHEGGGERARVTAERGVLNQRTEEMTAYGDVVVRLTGQNIDRIESEELHYEPAGDQIWSDRPSVLVRSDGSVTRGTCFRSDLEFQNYTVCNIRGRVDVGGAGG